jgi:hypothetical protein
MRARKDDLAFVFSHLLAHAKKKRSPFDDAIWILHERDKIANTVVSLLDFSFVHVVV